MRPLDQNTYVVKATDDDVLNLRTTGAGVDYLEVRHKPDGSILLRTKEAAESHGKGRDQLIVWKVNPGEADDYTKIYDYVERRRDEVVIVPHGDWYELYPFAKKVRFIHDDWDRTRMGKRGLRERPKELDRAEFREGFTPERWAEIEAREERIRQRAREYRAKRKAIDAGLIPPTPRLLKERAKRAAREAAQD